MFRRQLTQKTKLGSKQLEGCRTKRHKPSQDEDSEDMDFSAPRKSWLSAPQLQAQLSRSTDRTRRVRGECPEAARFYRQRPETARQ